MRTKRHKESQESGMSSSAADLGELLVLSLLQRTRVQFQAPTWHLTRVCDSGSRASDALFWLPWAPGRHAEHPYIKVNKSK